MRFDDEIAQGVLDAVEKSPGNPNRWRQLMLLAFDQKDHAAFRSLQMISTGLDRLVEAELDEEPLPTPGTGTLQSLPPEAVLNEAECAAFVRLAPDPNDVDALKAVGLAYLNGRHLPDVARQHFERALELCPSDKELKGLVQKAVTAASAQMSEATHAVVAIRDTSEIPEVNQTATEPSTQIGRSKRLPGERTQTASPAGASVTQPDLPAPSVRTTLQTADLDRISRRMVEIRAQAEAMAQGRAEAVPDEISTEGLTVSDETRSFIQSASPEQLIKRSMDFAREGRLDESAAVCRMALRRDPNLELAGDALTTLGVAFYERGRLEDAVLAYEQALTIDSNSLESWFNLGVASFDLGRREEALRCYLRALAIAPDHPKINCNLGTVYFESGQYDHAAQCFRQAVKSRPDYVRAWDNLAAALGAAQHYDEAVEACEHVLELNPSHPGARFKLGTIRYRQDRNEEAEACFRRTLDIHPEDGATHAYLAMLAVRRGELDSARDSCEQADLHNADEGLLGTAWSAMGRLAMERKRYTEAAEAFRRATEKRARDFQPWQSLGQALRKAGNLADAEHAFFFAVQMESQNPAAWRYLGLTRFDQHNFEGAAAAQQFATELKPDDASLWLELSASYQMMRHTEEAIASLQQALKADPASFPALKSLCLTLLTNHRGEEAVDILRGAAVHHPDNAHLETLLGRAHVAAGEHDRAIEHFEKAVALDESLGETWRALGEAYAASGRTSEASVALRKALDLIG